jgi:hypothetical protein
MPEPCTNDRIILSNGSVLTDYEIRAAFALIGALNVTGVESWIGYAEALRRFDEWNRKTNG